MTNDDNTLFERKFAVPCLCPPPFAIACLSVYGIGPRPPSAVRLSFVVWFWFWPCVVGVLCRRLAHWPLTLYFSVLLLLLLLLLLPCGVMLNDDDTTP